MSESTSLLDGDTFSVVGSVGEMDIESDLELMESSDHTADIYPFDEYEKELEAHLERMAFMYK